MGKYLSVDQIRSGIVHHGSLLVRELIPAPIVERLVDDIDRAFESKTAYAVSGTERAPWYAPFELDPSQSIDFARSILEEHDGVLAADSPRTMFDLLDAYEEVGITWLVTQYLGARPALSVKKSTLRRVTADSGTDWWHQDGSFLGRIGSLNIWLSLSHCGEDSPGLDIVGQRVNDILPRGTEGARFDWSLGQPVVERAAEGKIVRPTFRPGDALVFDEFLVHRTAASPWMTGTRYAIESWFFDPSTFPMDRIPLVL
jgi:hypothetical protein